MSIMDAVLAQLRRKYDSGLTHSEAIVASFLIIIGLLFLGLFVLRAIDVLRNRALKFRPLFDPPWDGYVPLKRTFPIAIFLGIIFSCLMDEHCGLVAFFSLFALFVINDRCSLEFHQKRACDLCAEIACAIRHRVPMDLFFRTLADERHDCKPSQKVADSLRRGAALSTALASAELLPPYVIVSIQAAEASGGTVLEPVLSKLSSQLRDENRTFAKLVTVGIVPVVGWILVLCLASGTCLLGLLKLAYLLRYVVPGKEPQIAIFHHLKIVNYGLPATLILFGATIIFNAYRPVILPGGLRRLGSRVPLLGARMRHRWLARTCHALSAMTESNVPLWSACSLVSDAELSGNFAPAFQRLGSALEKGAELSTALRDSGLPDSVTSLMLAGANSGTLASAFATAAEWHQSRAQHLDTRIAAILPCLTIPMFGLVVGAIYGSLFFLLTELREGVMTGMRLVH